MLSASNSDAPLFMKEAGIFINSLCLFYDFFTAFLIFLQLGARKDMSLAYERMLTAEPGLPSRPVTVESDSGLSIAVIFTSVESTLSALKRAGVLADRLRGRITLVVPQVVPYPLPLTSPPLLIDWNERRFQVIASGSPVETKVCVYLCRDRLETLTKVLSPRSLVVLAGRKRWWWPTAEERLARKLRRAGHEVVFTETE
jgi:hypothetical protein